MHSARDPRTCTALAAIAAGAVALWGCEAEPRAAAWRFVFDPPALASDSIAIEARIVEDGCDGDVEHYRSELRPGAPGAMPTELGPGRYALIGRSRDADCAYHALGCQVVDLPLTDGAEVVVRLEAASGERACPSDACRDGVCAGAMDAAVPDAGPRDAGGPEDAGPEDAGMPPIDAPPVDAGPFEIVPSNVGDAVSIEDGTRDLVVDSEFWFGNTDNGSIIVYGMGGELARPRDPGTGVIDGIRFEMLPPIEPGGAPLAVWVMDSLHVMAGYGFTAYGSRAAVLLVENDVVVEGDLSASADRGGESRPGPGGGRGGVATATDGTPGVGAGGGAGGREAGTPDTGGGGGGFGSFGGEGGASAGMPATGGVTYGDADCEPLRGGSGGGAGGDDDGGSGGNGGGGLQVTAGGRIVVASGGTIAANGGGGQGGDATAAGGTGAGGGGGSGGTVLLEAATVVIDGFVTANGGGGGQGAPALTVPGEPGQPGALTSIAAAGGGEGTPSAGGRGSTASGVAGAGGDAENAGGGGGGAGRIRIHTRAGTETYLTLSPNPASGLATVGRATSR